MTSDMNKNAATLEELEQRFSDLARNKSRLELINRLLTSLSSVAGLDNMLKRILDILMQTIGAANISIIFRLDDCWQLRDVFGEKHPFRETDNPDAALVLASGKALQISHPDMHVPYPGGTGSVLVENWIFPLLSQERKVGAICMEGMQLNDSGIFDELQPFFVYAGVMLDNEISNYSRLAEAHRRLQDSETLYRNLFEQSPDGIVLWSVPATTPIQFNEAAHTLLGYSREEFAALTVSDFEVIRGEEGQSRVQDTLNREGAASFESVHRTKTGENRAMFISLKMLELAGRQMILATHRDFSERKRVEEELRETQELFTLFMNYTPVYTFIKQIEEGQSRVILLSDNFVDMVGRPAEELRGRTMEEMFPAEFARKITDDDFAVVSEGKVVQFDEELNGRFYTTIKFPIHREGKKSLLAGFTIDITENKIAEDARHKLEQQMLHAQKLESLGVLAGGIAHDFNNILMAIIGNADLALMRINKESPAVDNLHNIELAASRAADLAKQMLAYSGKGKFVVENVDLNTLLEEMLHMLEVSISKKAVLRLGKYQPLPPVEADITQMRQIIMNLVINASEAIGDKSGVIAITTGCMICDRSYLKDVWLDENLTDGLYVYLEIADTGCGMDKDTLSKLFDPFFTTKFTGRGLGMAAVLGIVRGHRGAIKVYSEPGKGTTFKILLPASEHPTSLFNGDSRTEPLQGSGTVLLVDDEETIRGIGAEMLKALGFTTITAGDGREALEAYKSTPNITFVILDLTMPHMDGEQCFRELRRINPDVKVIMSSGYNEQEVAQRFFGKGLAGFLQKPYKLSTMGETIRRVTATDQQTG